MADEIEITRAPSLAPQNVIVTIDFDNAEISAGWMIPVGADDSSRNDRWTSVDLYISPYVCDLSGRAYYYEGDWTQSTTGNRDTVKLSYNNCIWVRGLGIATEFSQKYYRNLFYPYSEYRLLGVRVVVAGHNPKGNAETKGYGLVMEPFDPVLGNPEYDATENALECAVSKPPETAYRDTLVDTGVYMREWEQTMYQVAMTTSASPDTSETVLAWANTAEDEATVSVPSSCLTDAQTLPAGSWKKFTFLAYAEGLGGASYEKYGSRLQARGSVASGYLVSATYVIGWPAKPSITGIVTDWPANASGFVTVLTKVPQSQTAPVDSLTLQSLRNSSVTSPTAAATASGWTDVASVDAGDSDGFTDLVSSALPDRGKHVWYRVKAVHDVYAVYSECVEATALRRDSNILTDDDLTFTSAVSGEDGASIVASFSWSGDDSDGVEVSWSDRADAWESTNQPETYDVTWTTGTKQTRLVIRGLEEGTPYYVRARLYRDTDDYREFGDYVTPPTGQSPEQFPVSPVTTPTDLNLNAPQFVTRGSDIPLTWTFSGGEQQEYIVYKVKGGKKEVVAQGMDKKGFCAVSSKRALSTSSTAVLKVALTTGGGWTESDAVTVRIADAPTASVSVADVTSNAVSALLTSSTKAPGVSIAVLSPAVATHGPKGGVDVPDGEVVWSAYLIPKMTYSNSSYTCTVPMPKLDLHDGYTYTVAVMVTDRDTGMSAYADDTFTVGWSHKAEPPASVAITASGYVASVTATAPSNAALTDRFDLYRLTPGACELAGESLLFGVAYNDPYAPYGPNAGYRVCTRTYDGDEAWADFPSPVDSKSMRLDWDGKSVELPFNLELGASYTKDFELRRHMGPAVTGLWNDGVEVKETPSTSLVKGQDEGKLALLSEMAQYAGPVFVRTPDGKAYAADVQVGKVTRTYGSAAIDVSFDATRIDMPAEFMIDSSTLASEVS